MAAARSHPPTLIRLAERTLIDECRVRKGEGLIVAVSGGGDSSALLDVLARLAPALGASLFAHGVDHGLRPEAARELDVAEAQAARLGVPFARTAVQVAPGGNLQARARAARLRALEDARTRAGATRIATAHHANDRAETVLLRLLHGASPDGLAVLPAADGHLIRPLIRAKKTDVVRHLERHRIPFVDDPSNADKRFLRVRVRLELLPLLEELSPTVVDHLTSLADDLVADPLPEIRDPAGRPIALRRAHIHALRRALQLGRAAHIRVSGNRELRIDPTTREIRVDLARARPRPTPEPGRKEKKKGGAKPTKSG